MSAPLIAVGSSDAPALVLIPELAASGRRMRPLAEAWASAGRRVLMLDIWGSTPAFDYAPLIGQQIPAAVETAGPGALLVGVGFGGHLALLASAGMPVAPPVVTIATGIPSPEDAPPSLLDRLGLGDLARLGDLSSMFGGRPDSLASGGLGDLDRLAQLRTRVLAVALVGDRTIPPAAVDRLADRIAVPVVRRDILTRARGDAHLRWMDADPDRVITAVESWAAGSAG